MPGPLADALSLIPMPQVGPPTTGTWEKGTIIADVNSDLWVCSTAGTSGSWIAVGGGIPPDTAVEVVPDFYDTFPAGIQQVGGAQGWITSNGGGGSALTQVAPPAGTTGRNNVAGVLALNTGTTSTGRVGSYQGTSAAGPVMLFFHSTFKYTFWARVMVPVLATVAQDFRARFGFLDNNTNVEPTDGAYIEYQRSVSANWLGKTASNGTRSTLTGSIAVVANQWVDLKVEVDMAANLVTFYIDDVSIGTLNTNIPNGAGRETSIGFSIHKTAGTTATLVYLDRIFFKLS